MLGSVPQSVDHLKGDCLIIREEFDLPVAQSFPHARIKPNRLWRSPIPDSSAPVENRRLEQHFERMIQEN
jgi:hypothetical protein